MWVSRSNRVSGIKGVLGARACVMGVTLRGVASLSSVACSF